LPGTFRPQGLTTLATVSSLDCLARPISCEQRPWGSPFGAFSSLEVVVHSCTPDPLAVTAACRLAEPKLDAATRPKTGFRVLPQANPLRPDRCLARRLPEAPLGLVPLRGVNRLRGRAFRPTSSLAVDRRTRLPGFTASTSESRSACDGSDHEGRTPLSGFCTFTSLALGLSTLPGYGFTSRIPRPLLTVSDPLLGAPRLAEAVRAADGCTSKATLM
jgi:hypothetical protein